VKAVIALVALLMLLSLGALEYVAARRIADIDASGAEVLESPGVAPASQPVERHDGKANPRPGQ